MGINFCVISLFFWFTLFASGFLLFCCAKKLSRVYHTGASLRWLIGGCFFCIYFFNVFFILFIRPFTL